MTKLFVILSIILCNLHKTSAVKLQRTALFISFPLIGHVNPLISQAIELEKRGWKAYIVTCSTLRNHVEKYNLEFIDIGICDWTSNIDEIQQKAVSLPSFIKGTELVAHWSIEAFPHMYSATVKAIQEKKLINIDIAVVDFATLIGSDICETLNISCVINNPDVLALIGWLLIPPADYNPVLFINNSIHTLGSNTLMRVVLPIIRPFITLSLWLKFDCKLNNVRKSVGLLKSITMLTGYSRHVIIANTAFGLEYNRLLPPHIQLTGPMFNMNRSRKAFVNELSFEDREWIEFDSRSVIYVNSGTIVSFTQEQVDKLLTSLVSDKFRVIWKIRRGAARPMNIPQSIRVVDWLSSTLGHLAHENVKVFISHCGVNSVYESLWLDTPILCLPMFVDQFDIGHQIHDAGVGIMLDKFKFTSSQLTSSIHSLLDNRSYSVNIKRVQAQIRLHGGVERAANIIETVAEFGSDMFLMANTNYPMYAKYNLDIYLIWLLLIYVSTKIFKYILLQLKSATKIGPEKTKKTN